MSKQYSSSELSTEVSQIHWVYRVLAILIIVGLFLAVHFGVFDSIGGGTRTPSDVMPDYYPYGEPAPIEYYDWEDFYPFY